MKRRGRICTKTARAKTIESMTALRKPIAAVEGGDLPTPARLPRIGAFKAARTVADLLSAYIRHKLAAKEINDNTREAYDKRVAMIERACPDLLTRDVGDVGPTDIYELRNALADTPQSANNVLALIRSAFAEAHRAGRIKTMVWDQICAVRRYRVRTRRRKDLLPEEQRALMRAVELAHTQGKLADWERDRWIAGHLTGLRPFELRALTVDAVELGSAQIRIEAKGGLRGHIQIGPRMVELLERRIAQATGPWVFDAGDGEQIDEKKFQRSWKYVIEAAKELGLDVRDGDFELRPYVQRSCNLRAKDHLGASLPTIAASVIHQSTQTTATYITPHKRELSKLAAGVEEMLMTHTPQEQQQAQQQPQGQPQQTELPTTSPRHVVGKKLEALRVANKLSFSAAGKRVGVRKATWADWEREGLDSLTRIWDIARIFGVEPATLLP